MMAKLVNSYNSIAELRGMVDLPWTRERNASRAKGYLTGAIDRVDWHGIRGGANACAAALVKGYPEGEAKIDRLHDGLAAHLPRAIGIGRTLRRGDNGDMLDIHAVNRGDIGRAWLKRQRELKRGKSALQLCVDVGGNSDKSADQLTWRGVAGICLSEIMSKAGYSVELVACFAIDGPCDRNQDNAVISVVVKPAGIVADRGLLAASLCLTGFFRTLGFAAICRAADSVDKEVNDGLGHHLNADGMLPVNPRMTQVIVPSSIYNEATAREWIKQTILLLQAGSGRVK